MIWDSPNHLTAPVINWVLFRCDFSGQLGARIIKIAKMDVCTFHYFPLHRRLGPRAGLLALVRGNRGFGGDEAVGAERLELHRVCAGGGRGIDQRDGTVDVAGVVDARLGDDVWGLEVWNHTTVDFHVDTGLESHKCVR